MFTVTAWKERKIKQEPISVITCYDFTFSKLISNTNIDAILVGDSAGMVVHGFKDTIQITDKMIVTHIEAVRRGAREKFIIGDLPFLSYRKSLSETMNVVDRFLKAGANAVKLEGVDGNEDAIRYIIQSGVPVMGHVGLTPQFVNNFGGFKVQGKDAAGAKKILVDAKKLEELGCFSIVLECIPTALGKEISKSVSIPTIGIGAGEHTDGQVLVLYDLLGLTEYQKPKFVREFFDGKNSMREAIEKYDAEVKSKLFPTKSESYG
jgi:3-methyl-2-oxobutanoate hydroxymethyltransferase